MDELLTPEPPPRPARREATSASNMEAALQRYLARIDRYPLLSAEEEHQLAAKLVRTRDPALGRRLVLANLRFVVKVAFEYRHHPVRLLDLIQEGNLGLVIAVERFDPGRGVRLNTYAVWWIRAFIQEYIRRSISVVRFGTTRAQQRCMYRLGRERARLASAGGWPDAQALARALGVSEGELQSIEARMSHRDLSIEGEPGAGPAERGAADAWCGCPGPEVIMAEREAAMLTTTSVHAALSRLDPREQEIIRARYLSNEKRTLQELGESLGISRERVRQLETRAKAKMRKRLTEQSVGAGARVRRRRAPRRLLSMEE